MIIWKIYGLIYIAIIIISLPMHYLSMKKIRAPKNYKDIIFSDK